MALSGPRALALVRASYAVSLLVRGPTILEAVGGGQADGGARTFARILALRQLAEASVLMLSGSHRFRVAGAGIDAIHSGTALVLARRHPSRPHRHELIANAAVAAGLAAAGVLVDR